MSALNSHIERIVVDPAKRAQIEDLQYFHQITKALFLHRRKFLRANVLAAMKRHMNKEQVDALLSEMGFSTDTRTEQLDVPTLIQLADKILAVAPDASDDAVKKAYRRLLNQHHPDKLVAKGLPEEMMKLASEKTHEIRKAYERIRAARGF